MFSELKPQGSRKEKRDKDSRLRVTIRARQRVHKAISCHPVLFLFSLFFFYVVSLCFSTCLVPFIRSFLRSIVLSFLRSFYRSFVHCLRPSADNPDTPFKASRRTSWPPGFHFPGHRCFHHLSSFEDQSFPTREINRRPSGRPAGRQAGRQARPEQAGSFYASRFFVKRAT